MSKKNQEIFPSGTIYERIFHYIWKNPIEMENRLQLNIPDTIVFKNTLPVFWYFSDKNGNIKKKKADNLSLQNIFEFMTKDQHPEQVCSYIIYAECSERQTDPTKQNSKYSGLTYIDQNSPVKIEYFSSKELEEFLFAEKIPISAGILQKFIPPPTDNNSVFQVQYKSKLTQYSKITNKQSFNNVKMDKYERCCTFDGPDYFSTIQSAAKCTAQNLKVEAEKIIPFFSQNIKILEHLNHVSYGMLSFERLDFFFKIDCDEKVYLLFIANVRMKDDQFVSDEQIEKPLFKFREFEPIQSQNPLRPYQIQKLVVCLRCKKREVPDRFYNVPYKFIIEERMITSQANNIYPNNFNKFEVQNPRVFQDFADEQNLVVNEMINSNIITEFEENPLLQLTISSQAEDESFFSPRKQQKPPDHVYKNHEVPGLFSILHPKLDHSQYQKIKDEFYFQQQQIQVCLNCYMEITPFLDISKSRGVLARQNQQFRQNRIEECRSLDSQRYQITQQYQKEFKGLNDHVRQGRKSLNNLIPLSQKTSRLTLRDYQIKEKGTNTPIINSKSNTKIKIQYSECDQASISVNSKDFGHFQQYQIEAQYKVKNSAKKHQSQERSKSTIQIQQNQFSKEQLRISDYVELKTKKYLYNFPQNCQDSQNVMSDLSPVKTNRSINEKLLHSSISTRVSNLSNSRQNANDLYLIVQSQHDKLVNGIQKQKQLSSFDQMFTSRIRRRSLQTEQKQINQQYNNNQRESQEKLNLHQSKIGENQIITTSYNKHLDKFQLQASSKLIQHQEKNKNLNKHQSEINKISSITSKIQIYQSHMLTKNFKKM